MKALTISQPFASLIASGEKWIENRRWSTNYRGPIAIHAGKGTQYLDKHELAEYPNGCVIATAKLVACLSINEIRERHGDTSLIPGCKQSDRSWWHAAQHVHAEGPFCWVLEDVQAIEHIHCRGAQGLWDFFWNDLSNATH